MMFRFVACACLVAFGFAYAANAAYISPISDLITTSQPGADASHIIIFESESGIPAGGMIVITPESAFTIPSGFDRTDIDVAVSTGGPYVERTLGPSSNAVTEGVAVVTGASGSITITLNTTTGVSAGNMVRVVLGTSATHQVAGDRSPINPSATGTYRVRVETYNGGTQIDTAKAMVAIVEPVTLSTIVIETVPILTNGLPSGTIPAGSNIVELSFQTDILSTCRYATSTGVTYDAMTNSFSTIGNIVFYAVVSGHVDGETYHYYARCSDLFGKKNSTDYEITFSLAPTPTVTSSDGDTLGAESVPGASGISGSGGSGSFANGSSVLFQSIATISGLAPVGSTVHILKDGKQQATTQAQSDGTFTATVRNLERGAYTFVTYAEDSAQRKTSNFSSTLTLGAGTANQIGDVLLSPTIGLVSEEVGVGEDVALVGFGVPGTSLEITVRPEGGTARTYLASSTATTAGSAWEFSIPGRELARGTYEIRARTILGTRASNFSGRVFVGVGEAPNKTLPSGSGADINGDGKVNLVDFSILLTNWGTGDESSDLNADGTINLADFSILLFNWTG